MQVCETPRYMYIYIYIDYDAACSGILFVGAVSPAGPTEGTWTTERPESERLCPALASALTYANRRQLGSHQTATNNRRSQLHMQLPMGGCDATLSIRR
jgi:hypothetical protein